MTSVQECVLVLDTNVLHCVKLYLSYANEGHWFPYQDEEWSVRAGCIQREIGEKKLCEALIRGGHVFHFMKSNKVEFVRCSAVEVELLRLDAFSCAFHKAMMQSQIYGRWFNQFTVEDVNHWMTPQDYRSIDASLKETYDELGSFGVRVSPLHSSAPNSDVVWLSRGIMAMVYMDAMDSVVYANALVATATHLVTSDGQFSRIVNGFRNPCSEKDKEFSKELASLVRVCTGLELAYKDFPVSQKLSKLCP